MTDLLRKIAVFGFLFPAVFSQAQNPAYRLMYDQVYEQLNAGEYYAAKNLYVDLTRMYQVDPGDRAVFSKYALIQGDVEFFKEESKDLMVQYGYFFTPEDTLRNGSFLDHLRKHNLTVWLLEQSNELYPQWINEHPEGFYLQQKLLQLSKTNSADYYFQLFVDDATASGDSARLAAAEKYRREFEFSQFMEVLELCRSYGLPNNFDHGFSTYFKLQQLLQDITADRFNFERSWHHIFPYMEKAYFDGKISDSFLRIYDGACSKYYGYQYYGTLDTIAVKDEKDLASRRKKYGL